VTRHCFAGRKCSNRRLPTLRGLGDVIVLDNLAVHKQPEIRTAIEAARRAPALSPAL
jgi:hypothetical protein